LRSVEQGDRSAERRTRKKPYEAVCLFHILILPVPSGPLCRAMLRS
jgi:hypothetical protein